MIDNQELIEKAKKMYPIGYKTFCLFGEDPCTIKSHECPEDSLDYGQLWFSAGKYNVLVYEREDDDEKWAIPHE